ncbi:MAG TPA: NUDIX hydrolase [Microscillaceae bacterium]|jgi:8-oxo-dGTP diphosphatase|nr:NUDIX hydrolase [Microscillaceae bacterium]
MDNTASQIIQTFGNKLRIRCSGLLVQNDRILLVKHQYLGGGQNYLWAPPGGGVEFGDTIQESLYREFLEETGLVIQIKHFSFVNEFLDPPLHAIELFFVVEQQGGILQTGYDPEMSEDQQIISEIAFWSIDELKQEPQVNLHQCLHNCTTWEELLSLQSYLK